jgi:hypothetical protein
VFDHPNAETFGFLHFESRVLALKLDKKTARFVPSGVLPSVMKVESSFEMRYLFQQSPELLGGAVQVEFS